MNFEYQWSRDDRCLEIPDSRRLTEIFRMGLNATVCGNIEQSVKCQWIGVFGEEKRAGRTQFKRCQKNTFIGVQRHITGKRIVNERHRLRGNLIRQTSPSVRTGTGDGRLSDDEKQAQEKE